MIERMSINTNKQRNKPTNKQKRIKPTNEWTNERTNKQANQNPNQTKQKTKQRTNKQAWKYRRNMLAVVQLVHELDSKQNKPNMTVALFLSNWLLLKPKTASSKTQKRLIMAHLFIPWCSWRFWPFGVWQCCLRCCRKVSKLSAGELISWETAVVWCRITKHTDWRIQPFGKPIPFWRSQLKIGILDFRSRFEMRAKVPPWLQVEYSQCHHGTPLLLHPPVYHWLRLRDMHAQSKSSHHFCDSWRSENALRTTFSLIIKSGIKVVQNSADWNSVPTIICALENGASNLPKVGGKVFISPASTTREKGGGKACALTTTTSSTMGSKTSSTNQPKLVKWKGAVPMWGDTGRNGG